MDGAEVEDGGGTPEVNDATGVDGVTGVNDATAVWDATFIAVAIALVCVAVTDAPSVVVACWGVAEVTEFMGSGIVIVELSPETVNATVTHVRDL